jgi:hypothetical protein
VSGGEHSVRIKIPLLAIEVANLIALNRSTELPARMKSLVEFLETQPADFKSQWSFEGTKHFIVQSQELAANKDWLLLFFSAGGVNRDAITKELRAASESFKPE